MSREPYLTIPVDSFCVTVEKDYSSHYLRYLGGATLIMIWNAMDALGGSPDPLPDRPSVIAVRNTTSGQVVFRDHSYGGSEAFEEGTRIAADIERIGIVDWATIPALRAPR